MTAPRIGELFAGYGGLGMAVQQVYGGDLAWYSEFDDAPSRIMAHHHPGVPNYGDVAAIEWGEVPRVDILTGGFPCQDVSAAGRRAGMTDGTRSGLWSHMAHAIDILRPQLVVIENVGGLFSARAASVMESHPWCLGGDGTGSDTVRLRAIDAVLSTLSELGYDAEWTALRASDVGAAHGRLRVFITAHPSGGGSGGWSALPLAGGTGEPDAAAVGADPRPGPSGDTPGLTLLPTPMTSYSSRDVETWRAQRPAGNGNVRKAVGDLAIVAEQLLPAPRAADSTGVRGRTPNRSEAANAKAGLTPTDACQDTFGPYAPAIDRWEQVLGRPAPDHTEPGRNRPRLHAPFVEWLMGLPLGHVTATPGLTRPQQLKALGNGVVPQQGAAALRHLDKIRRTS